MQIATLIHIHNDEDLVKDTIASVMKYVGPNILVIYDGAVQQWGDLLKLSVNKVPGLYHNYNRNPYKNIAFGMNKLINLFPNQQWYCYCEYDVLFTSDKFKEDLKRKYEQNYWCVGNDHRKYNIKLPLFEKWLDKSFQDTDYLLGCCMFYSDKFIEKLMKINFYNKLLDFSCGFTKGFFPGFYEYDLSEHLYPTLAKQLGGNVGSFAAWNEITEAWSGRYKNYPMRFRPEIEELFPEAYIMHPVKAYDGEIRKYFREKRC
jgi:hypothetical protein